MEPARSISPRRGDQRIVQLAKDLSESNDRKVPAVLMALRPILNEAPAGTDKGIQMRQELWHYNILKVLVLVLRQDYSVIVGQWETAAELAALISNATCGLVLSKDDQRQLEEDHLPKSVENMLLLARHIHNIYANIPAAKETQRERADLAAYIQVVLDSVLRLCSGYFYICTKVISSQWLLQLLVSDDSKITNMIMAILEKLLPLDPQVLSKIEESTVFTLLDELVFKLTVNTDVSVASASCRCLLKFCDHHKPLVEALCTRYKYAELNCNQNETQSSGEDLTGLRPLLRRWEGQGFERDLKHVGLLLDSGSALKAKSQRDNECARYIQAIWRGYRTRQKLKKANRAFAKFQHSYRLKKAEAEQAKLQSQYKSELYHQMKLKRQQLLRQFHEKRLQTLEILPASRIQEYLKKEQSIAALRIQTLWRGHRERTKLTERQKVAQQVQAVIKIQRAFRKWLERKDLAHQEIPTHLKPPGLTDERRVELQRDITKWREQNPIKIESHEELEKTYQRAYEFLGRHYCNIRPYRKLQYQMENMVARLDTDMELLSVAPELKEVTEKDVEMFSSRSLPIATVAKQEHNQMLKKLQLPWWKTLGMDDLVIDEDEKDRIAAEVHLETLGL